ncbi:MAG TPA: ABC transporter permease [Bdellovibrionales bacterium]|nr:ABC transporter permease [Bdellovibrionales bacterium]
MTFLAIRHLLSRKRQTLLILSGISLGTLIYVAIAGIQLGFRQFIVDKLINSDAHIRITGHEEIVTPETVTQAIYGDREGLVHWRLPPSGKRDEAHIMYPQGWFSRLDEDSEVSAYAPQFQAQAIFRRGGVRHAGMLAGINVDRQLRVTNIAQDIKEGSFQSIGSGGRRIVIGQGLADKIGARIDETVFISTGTGRPLPFRITGVFKTGVQQIDESIAYGAIADVQQLSGTPGRVTNIAVKLHDVDHAHALAERWSVTSRDKVQSWDVANASFLQLFQIQDIIRNFITSTVLLVAAFGIYNVLTIIISQKKREIAILRALGYSPADVERIFLTQGAILGGTGATLGLVLGFLVCKLVERIPIKGAGFEKFLISYDPSIYLYGLLMAMLSALVASYIPARSARRMTPVDIIRSEG